MGAFDVLEDFYSVDPGAFDGAGLVFDVRAPDPDEEPKTVRAMLDEKGPAGGPRWPRFHDLVSGRPAKGLHGGERLFGAGQLREASHHSTILS